MLKSSGGQVLKDIKMVAPRGSTIIDLDTPIQLDKDHRFVVLRNKRIGINRYQIFIKDLDDGREYHTFNYAIRNKWEIFGDWHTPEYIAKLYNKKVDPDANKPRSQRASFWNMKSRPGSINYKQKEKMINAGI
jgi:hypothetical protein